ncbi:MAG: ankyrin repeat domain-containing protein [Alphaproteobacteria bacterium]
MTNNIFVAINNNHFSQIKKILRNYQHQVYSIEKKCGYSPLHLAVSSKNIKIILILLKYGHPLEILNRSGFTPLNLAAYNNSSKIVKILTDAGANLETKASISKFTPLQFAVNNNNANLVEMLILKGANLANINLNYTIEYFPHLDLTATIKVLFRYGFPYKNLNEDSLKTLDQHFPTLKEELKKMEVRYIAISSLAKEIYHFHLASKTLTISKDLPKEINKHILSFLKDPNLAPKESNSIVNLLCPNNVWQSKFKNKSSFLHSLQKEQSKTIVSR